MKTSFWFTALVLALSACSKEAAPPVQTERPALTQVVGGVAGESGHVYSGEIRARHEVALGFRVGGKVTQRLVDTGAVVKTGQVLARLDSADAGLQAGSSDAQYQLAEADVKRYRLLLSKNFVLHDPGRGTFGCGDGDFGRSRPSGECRTSRYQDGTGR
jgi:multidrug efflux system membrane fusion protein